jgi:predicted Rossmann fold flavoprotein
MTATVDVVVIGAGAAGLMCAATAGYRGRSVRVIDHANMPGKKILMSGGGRCNFTNLNTAPQHFLSANPSFCISALKRYTARDFFELVERHGIDWCEKGPGQLFCTDSSRPILDMLLTECEWAGVDIHLKTEVRRMAQCGEGFELDTSGGRIQCASVVIASGGLSIPTLGASGFGYRIAEQFGLPVLPTRAGLVPFTLQPDLKARLAPLSGISCPVSVRCGTQRFAEPMLITHRGLSGPAMLQISSYWQPGDTLHVDLLPNAHDIPWRTLREQKPASTPEQQLNELLPRRLAQTLSEWHGWQRPLQSFSNAALAELDAGLRDWQVKPGGTEGYRTAEVTLGGVDTRSISSRSFAANDVPGLFFIGEVLDVTGQLGGHNFQWAWSSGYCAGQVV